MAALLLPGFGWLAVAGSETSPETGAPILITPPVEVALEQQTLPDFLKHRAPSDDRALQDRLNRIGLLVATQSDRPQHVYNFYVVKGRELQAYSFPGGTICLTEALAGFFPNDDELAFAVAHELAHAALRHHVSQIRWKAVLQARPNTEKALLETVKSVFDRDSEMEADRFGALYAIRAGFRYTATYESLERLAKAGGSPAEDPSHPPYQQRIQVLRGFREELDRSLLAFDRGVEALRLGRPDQAIEYLRLFVAEFPNSFSGRVNLGSAYLARVRSQAGTPGDLAETLAILPDPGVVLRGILDLGDVRRAQEQLQQAMRFAHPKESLARAVLGSAYIRLGDLGEARRLLEEAVLAAPTEPSILLCKGNVEYLSGRFQEAESYYRKALEAHRDWPPARKNLALTLEKKGDRPGALEEWQALEGDPDFGPEARDHIGALIAGQQ